MVVQGIHACLWSYLINTKLNKASIFQLKQRVEEVFKTVDAIKKINEGTLENCLDDEVLFSDIEESWEHNQDSIDSSETKTVLQFLKGEIDLENSIILGHSYGSSTSLKVFTDDRNFFRYLNCCLERF